MKINYFNNNNNKILKQLMLNKIKKFSLKMNNIWKKIM